MKGDKKVEIKKPDYQNSIINLSASILKYYNCFIEYKSQKLVDNYLNSKKYNHVILMVLDGLGINIINKHLRKTDGLSKNLKGIITSVFPSTTVAATNAILSAKPPFVSGFVGWMQYNKFDDAVEVVFLNENYYYPAKKLTTSLNKILAYDNIVTLIKKANKDLKTEMIMPPFYKPGYESFDEQLDRLLMITKGEKSFSYCYWTEPDTTLHEYGIKAEQTRKVVQALNRSYERFIKEIDDDVLVITTADHGFIDIKEIDLFKYEDVVATFSKKPSVEPRALSFFIKEDKKDVFVALFNKYFQPGFLLLTKKELFQSELLGYGEKHALLDDFIGDYLAIATGNKSFKLSASQSFRATHAGLTKSEMEVPLIINH